ncbi:GumC family protein [Winogradskyella aurantia]|uniref:non-specific protein-tyrosine kinase n=1 Tax=Winogradskyella aurantia TaxID=1915063 RepID=A0A265UV83_9FLAO|nr:tyrosine-protein kinase domain-containing protein [Winogradskyella aurantia]OZV69225.1 hypothetical protein CA834_07140 [Winogradskyella aurantia]
MAIDRYHKRRDQGELIKHEVQKYLRYWYWFVLGLVLALMAAVLYLRYTPKVYSSVAKIKILNKNKGLELPSSAFVFNRSNINLENEIEILKSYPIIEQVVRKQNLTMRIYEEGNVLTTEIDRLPFTLVKIIPNDSIIGSMGYRIEVTTDGFEINKIGQERVLEFPNYTTLGVVHALPFELNPSGKNNFNALIGKVYLIKFAPVSAVTRGLKGAVNIKMLGKSSDLLQLSFQSQSRTRNERVLNELIYVFDEDGKADRRDVSFRTMEFIKDRFIILEDELDSIETSIKDYKQQNNLVTIETDAALGLSQRTEAEAGLFEVENQLLLSELLEEGLKDSSATTDLLPANIGLNSGAVNGLVSDYNTLVLARDKYGSSAGVNNPQVKVLNAQLADLKSNIFTSIATYRQQLEATKAQLEQKNKTYAAKVYSIPAKEKVLLDIKRQQEIKQTLYIFLLQKREEAAINYAITEPTIKVVEDALSSGIPVSPNTRSVYVLAIAGGLGLPFALIYLVFLLDTKLKSRRDIEEYTSNIPVVGELPKMKKEDKLLFTNPNDTSIQAEAFRILSSNVDYILPVTPHKEGKVIYCTSTIKGEGKTYVSLNLSLALSSLNKKVLLIGADLRNPQIHSYINKDKHHEGLSNYLHDFDFDWRSALIQGFGSHPQHDILLSGSMPPNPAHLLTNGRFKALIESAKTDYDYIIVDTAPTILVTDTMLISSLADATLYITRANYTEKKLLEFSKGLSDAGKLKNMVYLINGVDASKSYGYGYNYGYNYGYGSKS